MILSENSFSNKMSETALAESLACHVLDPANPEPILLACPPGFALPDSVRTQLAASGPLAHAEFQPDGTAALNGRTYTDLSKFGAALRSLAAEAKQTGRGALLAEGLENAAPTAFEALAGLALDQEERHFPSALITCAYDTPLRHSHVGACRRIGVDTSFDFEPDLGIARKPAIRRSR